MRHLGIPSIARLRALAVPQTLLVDDRGGVARAVTDIQLQEQLRQIENRPRDEAGPLRARQQKLNFDYRRVQKLFAALKDEAMVTLEAAGIPRYDIFA